MGIFNQQPNYNQSYTKEKRGVTGPQGPPGPPGPVGLAGLKSQISNLYFNTVKIHQVFCYI